MPSSRKGCVSVVSLGVFCALVLAQLFGPVDHDAGHASPGEVATHRAEPRTKAKPRKATKPHAKRKSRPPKHSAFAADSPWFSPEACEAALHAKPPLRAKRRARIGTWNLAWFPAGSARGDDPDHVHDVAWLACIVATLDVDVLAVQEVVTNPRGRAAMLDFLAALDARAGGKHSVILDDCRDDGRQHVGFIYDERAVEARDPKTLRELNPGRNACDMQLRPGIAATFRWKTGGLDLRAVSVHQDSGALQRDYDNRQKSVAALRELAGSLRGKSKDDVLVLGDWNTMGCESCAPKVSAASEIAALDLTLDAFTRVPADHACSEYFKGHGVLLDHVLVSKDTRELARDARVEAQGLCAARDCAVFSAAHALPAVMRLSDHCPLVLSLDARDLD